MDKPNLIENYKFHITSTNSRTSLPILVRKSPSNNKGNPLRIIWTSFGVPNIDFPLKGNYDEKTFSFK